MCRLPSSVSKTLVLIIAASFVISVTPRDSAAQQTSPELSARIQRVENGIEPISFDGNEPPMHPSIEQLMQLYKVPGLSIAVIDHFKIDWAKGYGVTEAGSHTPVTTHTLFQAGSISKPVAATGTLALVQQGKLSLDENVNDKLKSWQVPDNEFTKNQKVTLRRILSHSAGLTVHGFPGYEVGKPIPTLVQILNGEPLANTAAVRVDLVPGTKFRYSGGGVTVEQQLVIDVTGEPFPQYMREAVLDKIGMTESTYEQPLPLSRAATTATGTHADGTSVPGKWHIYPEMAAAGLWTTATDLAKFGAEIALSKQGRANHVLREATTREMLTPQIEHIGLGFFLDQYKNAEEFGHEGDDEGFQAILIMFADSGKGVAIMGNSDNLVSLADYLLKSVAKEYGWKYTPDQPSASGLLVMIADNRGAHAALTRYSELKKAGSTSPYSLDENTLIVLGYYFLFAGHTDTAIQTFKLEVQDYPNYWNAFDSLGEAYLKTGQKDLAILELREVGGTESGQPERYRRVEENSRAKVSGGLPY